MSDVGESVGVLDSLVHQLQLPALLNSTAQLMVRKTGRHPTARHFCVLKSRLIIPSGPPPRPVVTLGGVA